MPESSTKEADRIPKKLYAAPALVALDPTAVLNRLHEAAANGNEQAKLLLAQAEAMVPGPGRPGRSDVK